MTAVTTGTGAATHQRRPFYQHLYFWVIVGIVAGVLAAVLPARRAAKMSPLSALAYE